MNDDALDLMVAVLVVLSIPLAIWTAILGSWDFTAMVAVMTVMLLQHLYSRRWEGKRRTALSPIDVIAPPWGAIGVVVAIVLMFFPLDVYVYGARAGLLHASMGFTLVAVWAGGRVIRDRRTR